MKPLNSQSGFTLIEVMVALMILAVGLMGTAYMQTRSVQFGNESQNRSRINMLVSDMMDRMRANMIAASSDDSTLYTAPIQVDDNVDELSATTCNATTVSARDDTVCFYKQLKRLIPISNLAISTVDLDGDADNKDDNYQITVYWSDQQLSQGNLDADSDEGTTAQADCVGTNRVWSGSADLTWPENGLSGGICMLSHSWQFEVAVR